MGKRKKHKIRQLERCPYTRGADKKIQLEDESETLFRESIEQTDWSLVAKEKEQWASQSKKKTKKNKTLEKTIDLHGYTVKESKELLKELLEKAISSSVEELKLKIITGKGLRSQAHGGGVLAREIPLHIEMKWAKRILFIDESPASVVINGLPLKGDFTVIFNVKEDRELD